MAQFTLLDQVRLLETLALASDFGNALTAQNEAPVGATGTIVEILEPGQAVFSRAFW